MKRYLTCGLFILSLFVAASSCSKEDICTGDCPQMRTERTDILITGALEIWDNQVVESNGSSNGPVSFNMFDSPAQQFDILIELESGYQLVIHLTDKLDPDPQDNVSVVFPGYPGQDLSEKLRYVTAELRYGDDAPAWSTNLSGYKAPAGMMGSFTITQNDGIEFKGRIRELVLYHNIENGQKIEINGTFVAVVDYDGDK